MKRIGKKILPILSSLTLLLAVTPESVTTTNVKAASNAQKILDYDMSNMNGTTVADSAGEFDGQLINLQGAEVLSNNNTRVLNFKGGTTNSYIEIPQGVLDGLESVTVSTLVSWDGTGGAQWLYGLGQSDTHYLYYTPSYVGGKMDRFGVATNGWRNEAFASTIKLPEKEWKLVTTVFNGPEEKLETYVDGKLVATGSTNGFTLDNINNKDGISGHIAKSFYGPDAYFDGMIADFEIFNGALDSEDVRSLYSQATEKIEAIGGLDGYTVNIAVNQLTETNFIKYNKNVNEIKTDLNFPDKGQYGTTITWDSSNKEVITNEGKVIRPSFEDGDQTVVVTATVSDGNDSQTKEFTLTVLKDLEASVAIQEDANNLSIHHVDDVRGNLPLHTKGENGSTISWESSNPSVITTTGEVERPENGSGDVQVDLTATLTLKGQIIKKEFTATVKEMPKKDEDYAAYLMTYFNGEAYADGEQIRFALSEGNDVTQWNEVNNGNPVLTSNLGEKGLRDPSIIRSPEGDKFYLLATDLKVHGTEGWTDRVIREGSNSLMIWESTDLVNWSEQRMVEITNPDTGMTWAPEVFYDDSTGEYIVYWSSFVYDSVADRYGDGESYNRIMYAKTRDFYTFTEPKTLLDLGHDILDTVAIEHNNKIYRITKGTYYTEKEFAGEEIREHVFQEVGDSFFGDFTLTKEGIGMGVLNHGEGAEIFKSNSEKDKFYLLIDEYGGGRGYTLFETTDIESADWKLSEDINLPDRPRHGDVLSLTQKEYERLLINTPGVGVEVIEPGEDNETPGEADKTPPEGQFTINSGAEYTNEETVTLSLEANDDLSGVHQVRYSTDSEEWSDWEQYKPTKELTLPTGDGKKTVFVEFKDNAGNISKTYEQKITLDTTAPVIQFTGLQDSYSVDSHINITCSATDDLSGISSKECPNVEGPAYKFELGINKITATATDKAGNTMKMDIQFIVTVDFDSLSKLTEAFVTKRGVADSLMKKLQSAKESAAKGNHQAMNGQLNAYENQLKAQSGKSITEENTKRLIHLLKQLK